LPDGLLSYRKIPICVYFGGPLNVKCWCNLWPFEVCTYVVGGHFLYFMAIWYSLWSFGKFFPFWCVWTKKNLATLIGTALWVLPSSDFSSKIVSQ
jgi:hypothetical protein